jgi:hypothetical protein
MRTVADPDVLRLLIERLRRLEADGQRRWGTLTPHEMLCHLGDAAEMVLMIRPRTVPVPAPRHGAIVKWLVLWTPMPLPRGVATNPRHDPRREGTRPSGFEHDRARAIASLEGIARAAGGLEPVHGIFGPMSCRDWHRWAYRHTDYHLRQFGV